MGEAHEKGAAPPPSGSPSPFREAPFRELPTSVGRSVPRREPRRDRQQHEEDLFAHQIETKGQLLNYSGQGFEIIVRCTGNRKAKKKHRYDFGRVVFTTAPFNDNPSGDVIRESWPTEGGWVGILGIELPRHRDGSFRRAKVPSIQIFESHQDDQPGATKILVRCPVCGTNRPVSLQTLDRIIAQKFADGEHVFDVSK